MTKRESTFLPIKSRPEAQFLALGFQTWYSYVPVTQPNKVFYVRKAAMASKLIVVAPYEAEIQLELSLRQAFELLQPKLRPPFPLTIPSSEEYVQLNKAILYGVLCEPHLTKTHIKHLHAIVTDGYELFSSLLGMVVNELYVKLVESAKIQLIWVTKVMIDVSAVGVDASFVCLLRQIVGGDFTDANLWLSYELVSLCLVKWDCLLEEQSHILTSALYTYLRLLADHCKLSGNPKLEALRQLEIDFCVKMLNEQFHLCLNVGRDLVRLLQDLVHVPAFRGIWKTLVLNPGELRAQGFSDLSQLYLSETPRQYFLLRITPEVEIQLRFLLTHVKFGNHKRHEAWFLRNLISSPEKETCIVDIIRFICCACEQSSDSKSVMVPRWSIVGSLLKCCRKNYVEANAKLALFYDWLFFDEKVDSIMSIEPAMLLMLNSIPNYIELTNSLLDFLLLLSDQYDMDHKNVIVRGVSSAFNALVQSGVVRSLDVFMSCSTLSPFVKKWFKKFLLDSRGVGAPECVLRSNISPHNLSHRDVPAASGIGIPALSSNEDCAFDHTDALDMTSTDAPGPIVENPVCTSAQAVNMCEFQVATIEGWIQNLREAIKKSNTASIQKLENILFSFLNLCNKKPQSELICPQFLSSMLAKEFQSNGYNFFASLERLADVPGYDDEIASPSALLFRTYIFSQHNKMCEMLLFWARNDLPVGARFLSYTSRLAYEAYQGGYQENRTAEDKTRHSETPFLMFHLDGYPTSPTSGKEDSFETIFSQNIDKNFLAQLVKNAFAAYKCFLRLQNVADMSPSKLLFSDLRSCSEWKRMGTKFLFSCVFVYLSDLSSGDEDILRLLICSLDNVDLAEMQFEIGSRKFSLLGNEVETITHLIKSSLRWDYLEQHKFWSLVRAELAVSKMQVEKIILEFFLGETDLSVSAIAVGGLLAVCSSCIPTPELVGAVMLLPNNMFPDFSAACLASWVVSNESMLVDSLCKFSENLKEPNGGIISSNPVQTMMNHSAVLWLLDYANSQGSNFLKQLFP